MTLKIIFGIVLMLVLVIGLTQTSFAEYPSPREQLEINIAPEDIFCNHKFILVLRANDKIACVSEKTAEKLDWNKIVRHNIITKELEQSNKQKLEKEIIDIEEKLLVSIQTVESRNLGGIYSNEYMTTFTITANSEDVKDIQIMITSDVGESYSHILNLDAGTSINLISFIDAINTDSITAHLLHYNLVN